MRHGTGRVFWYKDGGVLSYYSQRGGVSIASWGGGEEASTSLLLREVSWQVLGAGGYWVLGTGYKKTKHKIFCIHINVFLSVIGVMCYKWYNLQDR